jgi:uncharacterized protein (TIGR02996 family)
MTTEERALLAAILAEPDDDTVRLAYADWLDENGRGERGEFIRVQVEVARTENYPGERYCAAANGLLRVGVPDCDGCGPCRLRGRARDLWRDAEANGWFDWTALGGFYLDNVESPDTMTGVVRRGFVGAVTVTGAEWLRYGDAISAAHPVTEVTLASGASVRVTHGDAEWATAVLTIASDGDDGHRWEWPGHFRRGTNIPEITAELFRMRWPSVRTFHLFPPPVRDQYAHWRATG